MSDKTRMCPVDYVAGAGVYWGEGRNFEDAHTRGECSMKTNYKKTNRSKQASLPMIWRLHRNTATVH